MRALLCRAGTKAKVVRLRNAVAMPLRSHALKVYLATVTLMRPRSVVARHHLQTSLQRRIGRDELIMQLPRFRFALRGHSRSMQREIGAVNDMELRFLDIDFRDRRSANSAADREVYSLSPRPRR